MPRSSPARRDDAPPVRIPPYSMEAERAVLGALLLAPEKTLDLLGNMNCVPEWFYIEANRTIYEAARTLHDRKGAGVDAVTVVSALQEAGALDSVGGAPAVERLVEGELVVAHTEYYADILKQKYTLRRIVDAASAAIEKCYSPDRSTAAILSDTQEEIFAIADDGDAKQPDWDKSLKATFGKIDRLFSDTSGMNGLSTGFKDLDKVVQGMRDSEMIVLAARPSMGKTSLAMNICTSVALDVDCNGKPRPGGNRDKGVGPKPLPVAIFSCEMSTDALITRLLCTLSGVPFTNIVDRTYVKSSEIPKMQERLTRAAATLTGAPIFIDDTGGLDIMDVRARARRLKKQHGIRLIMIDYLQLLNSREGSDEGRQQETTKISAGIKAMAKELNVPVLVLSQLSRAPEQRDKAAKPRLSDLRDSGSIEQDADVVLLLRRPCKYPGSPDSDQPNLAVVDVAKNRNGATGEVNLNFDGNVTRFSDYAYAVDRENPAAL
jgi:replicative DNA helicase